MLDNDGYHNYLRQRISLENKLTDIGSTQESIEIESQMMFVEERLLARIKQSHSHARQELNALKMVLIESSKDDAISEK